MNVKKFLTHPIMRSARKTVATPQTIPDSQMPPVVPEHRRVELVGRGYTRITHELFQLKIHLPDLFHDRRSSFFQQTRQNRTSGGDRIGSERHEFIGISSVIYRTVGKYLHISGDLFNVRKDHRRRHCEGQSPMMMADHDGIGSRFLTDDRIPGTEDSLRDERNSEFMGITCKCFDILRCQNTHFLAVDYIYITICSDAVIDVDTDRKCIAFHCKGHL